LRSVCRCTAVLVLLFIVHSGACVANTISLHGSFYHDDDIRLFELIVGGTAPFLARTWSYAGGVAADGTDVPAGGFAPVLSLFAGDGTYISNQAGDPCAGTDPLVARDPETGMCFDAYFYVAKLDPGRYILSLTEWDNVPRGNLEDGFTRTGQGNFTGDQIGLSGTPFIDPTPARRDGHWALDITGPDTVTPVPEPAMPGTILFAGIMGATAKYRRSFSRARGEN